MGFKLFWGCFVFYPFFYPIGVWNLLPTPDIPLTDISIIQAILCVSLFYFGWVFTRGPNLQKFYSKKYPKEKTCLGGCVQQKKISGSSLLCSGFWGLSRHINYLGETVQALALALPGLLVSSASTSFPFFLTPLLYPLYYILLFVPRQIDDEAICAAKYGIKWKQYIEKVPYRIVPGLY